MITPVLQVVYVNYRANAHLVRSLESVLARRDEVPGGAVEVSVVDNSVDVAVSEELRAALAGRARLIVAESNVGFATGCNRGALDGTAPNLLFLNPDTHVCDGALGLLLDTLEREHNSVVGPRHFADDGCVFAHAPMRGARLFDEIHDLTFAHGWSSRRSTRYLAARGRLHRAHSPVDVRCISGGCLGIRRSAFERMGRWNEDYWMYGEDVEFSVRARQRGLRIRYLPHAKIVHEMEVSAKQQAAKVTTSRMAGRTRFKQERYGCWITSLEDKAFQWLRRRLPKRGDPWAAAVPLPGSRIDAPPDCDHRWALEIARSPLFDNCLTAFSTADHPQIEVPDRLMQWFPPGPWFFRRARELSQDIWQPTDLWQLDVPAP